MLSLGGRIEYIQEGDVLIIQQWLKKETKYYKKASPKLKENSKYTILTENLDCQLISIKVILGF